MYMYIYIHIHMLIRQPPVLPSLRIGISRSSGEHSRYAVWKESNDDGGCCRCIFELAKPYGNNELMSGVKVLLEVQKKSGRNGRCLSPVSCRWWLDPLFQEWSGDSRSVIQEGHDLGRFDEIRDLCLVAAMEKMWGIEVSRARDAAGWVEGLRGLQGFLEPKL